MNIFKVKEKLYNFSFLFICFKDELEIPEIVKDTITNYEIIILIIGMYKITKKCIRHAP